MKVPLSTAQSCDSATTKLLSSTTLHNRGSDPKGATSSSSNNNNKNNLCYEPTLALDLKHNPSTATEPSVDSGSNHRDQHSRPPTVDLDNLEGWDSILCELGLNDDNSSNPNNSKLLLSHISPHHSQVLPDFPSSQPFDHTTSLSSDYPSPFPDLSYTPNLNSNFGPLEQQQNNNNNNNNSNISTLGLDFLDDLVRAAQAFESKESTQLSLVLSRLNERLRSPVGKPIQRAAFYFKEALQYLSNNPTRPASLSSYDVVQTIRATEAFSGISPISLFSAFAANQAVLDAVEGASFIHIVDFDIGFGGQWASFMRELVDKAADLMSVILRITAIIPEEFSSIESKLVKENLLQFARELNLNFHIEFVLIPKFDLLSFKSIKFMEGERIVIHLSPPTFYRFANYNNNSPNGVSKFIQDFRSVSPCTAVVVDKEVGVDIGTTSFAVSFVAGIEYYTGMLESLDAAATDGDCMRKIENFVLRPRILAAVEVASMRIERRSMTWREAFAAAGMRVVGFSQFADFQAECLLRRAQVNGFHVAKRHGEMMLLWHDRPLVTTSAWKY